METWITHIYSESTMNCDFCGLHTGGYSFGIDGYCNSEQPDVFDSLFKKRGMECCGPCATILLGKDSKPYAERYDAYQKRWDDFRGIQWRATCNPLVQIKAYKRWHVGIMRDKYGRNQYGVLLGSAERWHWREKMSPYEDQRNIAIRDEETAERVAFRWVDFVDFFNVSPEDPYSTSDFNSLAKALLRGDAPENLGDIDIYRRRL